MGFSSPGGNWSALIIKTKPWDQGGDRPGDVPTGAQLGTLFQRQAGPAPPLLKSASNPGARELSV